MHNAGVNSSEVEPLFWTVTERALLSAALLAIMVVSVIGNSLVIIVIIRNRGMRTRTNLFLCSLAVADLLCSLLAMPFSLATAIRAEWIFDRALCLATGFMAPLFVVASIHTLMYISVHRFVTVRNPHSRAMTQRRIVGMIAAAWAWSILASAVSISGLTEVCSPCHLLHSYAALPLQTATLRIAPRLSVQLLSSVKSENRPIYKGRIAYF